MHHPLNRFGCWLFIFFSILSSSSVHTARALELTTTVTLPTVSTTNVQDFLSRPVNWPQIVLSSNSVASKVDNPELPLLPNAQVDEFFGLNLLSVTWVCTKNIPGEALIVESKEGLRGIAKDCAMEFGIEPRGNSGSQVTLTMKYTPTSPLALAATPALVADNWIALNVLLPLALNKKSKVG